MAWPNCIKLNRCILTSLSRYQLSLSTPKNRSIIVMAHPDPWPIVSTKRPNENNADLESNKKVCKRVKKRMYAILLAYSGLGYHGLQRNANLKTIEEDVLVALRKINVLNDDEFKKVQTVKFQRAARTDKGVSALRQVLSLMMPEGIKPSDINEFLPDQIRVLAVRQVTKGFNSKNTCDSRTYSYTCPTFAFCPPDVTPSYSYRITDDVIQLLTDSSKLYLGSKNYWHFTSGRRPNDPSCIRYIMRFDFTPPVVREDMELIIFHVKGQSFMLHQIRKMMGTLMAICRGYIPPEFITCAFKTHETRTEPPVAPGLGLLLEEVHYDWYNKKYGDDGMHERLDFVELESQVEEFRERFIFPSIVSGEKEENSTLSFLTDVLPVHFEEHPFNIEDTFQATIIDHEASADNDSTTSKGDAGFILCPDNAATSSIQNGNGQVENEIESHNSEALDKSYKNERIDATMRDNLCKSERIHAETPNNPRESEIEGECEIDPLTCNKKPLAENNIKNA